jgi:hypothetical protein
MIVFGLFLLHLAEFVAAYLSIDWLIRWFNSATIPEVILTFVAAFGAVAATIVLMAKGRGGVVIAVAIVVFWLLVIFGATGTTAIIVLALAAAAIFSATAVALVESSMVRRQATRNRP